MAEPVINESGEIVRQDIPRTPESEELINYQTRLAGLIQTACENLKIQPTEVFVPGSGNDVLPPTPALKGSHIIYTDIDQDAVNKVIKAGLDGRTLDVEKDPLPEKIDFMVLNGIQVAKPLDCIIKNGFVFSDGRMGSAEFIATHRQDFKLVGVLTGDSKYVSDNLDPYLASLRKTETEQIADRLKLREALLNNEEPKSDSSFTLADGYIFQRKE